MQRKISERAKKEPKEELLFDGGRNFLWNISKLLPDYTASHRSHRRQNIMLYPGKEPPMRNVYEDERASAHVDDVQKIFSPMQGIEPRFLGPNYYNN
jgi:hypothetical protein